MNPATAPSSSAPEEIARILKETLNTLKEKNTATSERAQVQREEIMRALTESKGRVGGADGAAAKLGINRTTLMSRMKKFGISPRQYS